MVRLVLLILVVYYGINATNFESNFDSYEEEMSINELESSDEEDALEKMPFQSDDSSSSCPSHCIARRADGRCDPACNTGACWFDFGDCSQASDCSCRACRSNQCHWKCALGGCQMGTCRLSEEGQMEFFWAQFPSTSPHKMFNNFYKTEKCLERQLGFEVILESDKNGPLIFGRRRSNLELTRMTLPPFSLYNLTSDGEVIDSTLALFSIRSDSIITTRSSAMDVISRMGYSRMVATITPFTLSKEDRSAFVEDALYPQRYNLGVKRYQEWAERTCEPMGRWVKQKVENF